MLVCAVCDAELNNNLVPDCIRRNLRESKFKFFHAPDHPSRHAHYYHPATIRFFPPQIQNPVWNPTCGHLTKYFLQYYILFWPYWALLLTAQFATQCKLDKEFPINLTNKKYLHSPYFVCSLKLNFIVANCIGIEIFLPIKISSKLLCMLLWK